MSGTIPEYLANRIDNFTGRAWLLDPLMKWLAKREQKRFCVLTGGPGTGKSMVAAWLSGAGPLPTDSDSRSKLEEFRKLVGAIHFCGDGGGNKDPKTAVKKMVTQLEAKLPGFREEVLANIDRNFQANVNMQVGTAATGSSVIGLLIENLGMSAETAFNQLLREPLKSVYDKGCKQHLVLIVDSLDEAETFSGDVKIPYLFSTLEDLPSQVSILVTTRPDERVMQDFPSSTARRLDLVNDEPKGADDIRLFAEGSLMTLGSDARVELAKQISLKAQGVFLYASFILPELIAVMEMGGDPNSVPLPNGLTELYRTFLRRELTRDKAKWFNVYAPLLGAIAVAQGDGLDREQLKGLVGFERDLREALLTCKQYLIGDTSRGPFRIFHQSFADFLFDEDAMEFFSIDAREMHRRIVESYEKRFMRRWSKIDAYGINYLLGHLFECDTNGNLAAIHGDNYARQHLFYHLVNASLAEEIGKLVARVCHI